MTPGPNDLWLLPLGGCGEIGINLNLYGHDGQWLMVDCGIGFERGGGQTGVFAASADFIASRRDRLLALLVTHAHEDHVGAVAHHWRQLRCPVYCTPFTAEILSRKLAEAGLHDDVPLRVVQPGQRHQLGSFEVQWVHLTHSTPESQALLLQTPVGRVLHTGDWKLDPDPVIGPSTSPAALQRIGDAGVLALVCDSTNATVPGRSVSEGALYAGLLAKVSGAAGRVVIACFGSNVARLVTLARVAQAAQRHTGLMGRSLTQYYRAAHRTGLWPQGLDLAEANHLGYLPRHEVFAVVTGSQGEPNAALARLARGSHPAFELEPGDRVIFSSREIPGNEDDLARLRARLEALGVEIITEAGSHQHIHASGHPAQDELADMYAWIRPQIAVPVHGTPVHLDAHAELARQLGVPRQLNGRNGDLFMLAPQPGIRRAAAGVGRITLER